MIAYRAHVDAVELALVGGELAARREHAGHVGRVVVEVGRVVEEHQVAGLHLRLRGVIVRPRGVLAGGDQAEIGRPMALFS